MLTSARRGAYALAFALSALPTFLLAQATTGSVRGRVTEAAGGRGLPDAQVSIEGTRLGAVTNANGAFTILTVPSGARTVVVRRLGYSPATKAVTVATDVADAGDIVLSASALNLTEVVVTGTAAPTEKRKLGTSIASVDSTIDQSSAGASRSIRRCRARLPARRSRRTRAARAAAASPCACAARTRSSPAPIRSTSSTA